tara:strand:+ start:28085 stop:28303 length:219 start_codon:yes stop_codon:yes gene_type:complete
MYGRSVGARVNFHFNVIQVELWKICLIYPADVSFQCLRNFVIARYEIEIEIEIEIETQKIKTVQWYCKLSTF